MDLLNEIRKYEEMCNKYSELGFSENSPSFLKAKTYRDWLRELAVSKGLIKDESI